MDNIYRVGDQEEEKKTYWVLDPEHAFDQLGEHAEKDEFTWCLSAKDAISAICDPKVKMDGLFLSQDLSEVEWLTCVKAMAMARNKLPIFNLVGENCIWRLSDQELNLLKHNKTNLIYKSKLRNVIDAIEKLSGGFDKGKLFSLARNEEEAGVALASGDSEFVPINITQFMSGKTSVFDVYIKLFHNQKYIKVFSAKDPYDEGRVLNYMSKGLEFLYIRTETAKGFVTYADYITKNAVMSNSIDLETKYSIILSQACQTLKCFRTETSEDTIELAKQYSVYAKVLIEELRAEGTKNFPIGFFPHLTQFEHSAGTVLIAGLIAGEMDVQSKKALETVTLAALLHDISLTEEETKISAGKFPFLSDEMKSRYLQHPRESSELVQQFSNIDESIVQGIFQHHMRIRGESFPKRAPNTQINWLGCVIGLADEIVHAIHHVCGDWKTANMERLKRHLDEKVFPGFSKTFVMPAKAALFPEKD